MSTPNDDLIEALKASDGLSAVSVTGVIPHPLPPAVVVRPFDPWAEPSGYCPRLEHYVAIAVVTASSTEDGVNELYVMTRAIIDALPETWEFVSVGAPIIDESTGVAFLAAPVRVDYKGAEA